MKDPEFLDVVLRAVERWLFFVSILIVYLFRYFIFTILKLYKMNNRKPFVGEIILFTANPDDTIAHSNHNMSEIPAIVTRVWSEICVNCKIIPDCGAMQDRTSVVHYTANPAGYHFRFIGENKKEVIATENGEDAKDASSFLKSNS